MEVPMAMGRPKATLELSSGQRQQLESIAGSRSLPAGLVNRARIVLMSAAGETNQQIAGLYMNPPENAVVLCVDEKSQIQALERTQPMLPMGLGYVEGVTHDYRRHGTTTLFAALDTAKGTVITQCRRRHRHQEYLNFLRQIEKNVPPDLNVHLIADNYAIHKQSAGETVVCGPAALSGALYSDLRFLAQPGGDLVQPNYPTGHS